MTEKEIRAIRWHESLNHEYTFRMLVEIAAQLARLNETLEKTEKTPPKKIG